MASVQKMSVTQGLAELKLLGKRIDSRLEDIQFVEVVTKKNGAGYEESFTSSLKANFQSYVDLMERRMNIKQAIVLANAATRVKIGRWEGTVAEAIEYKSSHAYKKKLLDRMKQQLVEAQRKLKDETAAVNRRLDVLLQSELGKDVRTNPETITAITDSFKENNKVSLLNPLDLSAKIKELEEEITEFQTNVDWVLSEANANTYITVPS
jgi:hypothetical protein